MNINNLTKQAEDLIYQIGQQASYKDLHVSALCLLKGLYALEQPSFSNTDEARNRKNNSMTREEEELVHVEKAKRKLLKWVNNQNSVPAQILIDYLGDTIFQKTNKVSKYVLEKISAMRLNEDTAKFNRNFDQMKNFDEKNHAKIFDVSAEGIVTIWPPIEKYVEDFKQAVFKGKTGGLLYSHYHSGELAEE